MCICAYLLCSCWPCFSWETIWCEVGSSWLGRDEEMKWCAGEIQPEEKEKRVGIEGNKRCDTAKVGDGSLRSSFDRDCAFKPQIYCGAKARQWLQRRVAVCSQTFVVLTLLPVLQLHPVRSGRTLHSSPSIQGCIWHHHFWATMEAGGREQGTYKDTLKPHLDFQVTHFWMVKLN